MKTKVGLTNTEIMNRKFPITIISCLLPTLAFAQKFNFDGEYCSELQWNMDSNFNWANYLRLNLQFSPWKGGSLELATMHIANTRQDRIIDDWQGFSNILEENNYAILAKLGYRHSWENAHIFFGVSNTNEDFFVSDCALLFVNESPGAVPTISANYPYANYPLNGLTLYFDVTFGGGFTLRNGFYNGVAYNGWKHDDNPFIFNPKRDGVYDQMELTYEWDKGFYSLGAGVHNRLFTFDDDLERGFEMKKKASAAIWFHGEETLWKDEDNDTNLTLMAQYSENTAKESECRRYAEIGFVAEERKNTFGFSGQYAKYAAGEEYTVELTYKYDFNDHIYIQPTFQYINNPFHNFTPLVMRFGILF
ncbi:MAG: carbohydrate porin [Bacteroidales bacterium]|nr:carbohydrate porin [Bacteroidales bacterium]